MKKKILFSFSFLIFISLFSVISAIPTQKAFFYDFYQQPFSFENFNLDYYFDNYDSIAISTSDVNCISNCDMDITKGEYEVGEGESIWFNISGDLGNPIFLSQATGNTLNLRIANNFNTDYLINDLNITFCDGGDCISKIYNFYLGGFYEIYDKTDLTYLTGSNVVILKNNVDAETTSIQQSNFSGIFDGLGYDISNLRGAIDTLSGTFKNLIISDYYRSVYLTSNWNVYFIGTIGASGVLDNVLITNGTIKSIANSYTYPTYTKRNSHTAFIINNYGTINQLGIEGDIILDTTDDACYRYSGGISYKNFGLINNSYSKVDTTSLNLDGDVQEAGFVRNNTGTIQNSYFVGTGDLEVTWKPFAEADSGSDLSNFFDYEIAGTQISAMGTYKTTSEMKDIDLYLLANWNIQYKEIFNLENDWLINDGLDYPQLPLDTPLEFLPEPPESACPYPIFYLQTMDETLSPYTITSWGVINLNAFYDNYTTVNLKYFDNDTNTTINYSKSFSGSTYSETCKTGTIETCLQYYPANPPTIPNAYMNLRIERIGESFDGYLNLTFTNLCGSRYDFFLLDATSDIPQDEIPASLFKNIVDTITSLFPDHSTLNFAQKSAYVLVFMGIITIILLLATGSFKETMPPIMAYILGAINFLIFSFFISIKYVSVGVLVLTALIAIGVSYFRFKGGS